jgi:hypothetical protein
MSAAPHLTWERYVQDVHFALRFLEPLEYVLVLYVCFWPVATKGLARYFIMILYSISWRANRLTRRTMTTLTKPKLILIPS